MPQISRTSPSFATRLGHRPVRLRVRGLISLLLVVASALSAHLVSAQTSHSTTNTSSAESDQDCKYKPFAYDNGPTGQATWCGQCNADRRITRPMQAPINIQNAQQDSSLPPITFNYNPMPLKFLDNLHNVKVDGSRGGAIKIRSLGEFKLVEFHVHRPSEEAINNRRSAMVIHLVHEGNKVVSILVEAGAKPTPKATELISKLTRNFPPPPAPPVDVLINAGDLLPPGPQDYFSFAGSLTTPPCTEGVTFYVLKTPIILPADQIEEFARRYPSPNARDIQDTNDRRIVEKVSQ